MAKMKRARALPMPDNPRRQYMSDKTGLFQVIIEERLSAFGNDWIYSETVKTDIPYEEAATLARQRDEGLTPPGQTGE